MNRKTAKEILPIVKALSKGKKIQFLSDKWEDVKQIDITKLIENPKSFRIKPESKRRPLKHTNIHNVKPYFEYE